MAGLLEEMSVFHIEDASGLEPLDRYMRYCWLDCDLIVGGIRKWRGSAAFPVSLTQSFARKVIRCIGGITEADIQKEADNITSLLRNGGHANIVNILQHGNLRSSGDCYIIDMELCDLTLHDYIRYRRSEVSVDFSIVDTLAPVFAVKDCTSLMRMRNVWEITSHVANALEFMHSSGQVHRDLKPSNGTCYARHADLVLYSKRENRWKLTDFGLSSEATSKKPRSTEYGVGTPCYRAPELLTEGKRRFTNKVDMWALGCLIAELVTLKVAFPDDYFTQEYARNRYDVEMEITFLSPFLHHHVRETILDLLNKEWNQRPSASQILPRLQSYNELLSYPVAQTLIGATAYPSYMEWKMLSESPNFPLALLSVYCKKGVKDAFLALGQFMRDQEVETRGPRVIEHADSLWEYLAALFLKDGDFVAAASTYKCAIEEKPCNYWLWQSMCETFVASGDYAGAIAECKRAISQQPGNWSPVMEFSNLSAAQGDFRSAINAFIQLSMNRWDESLWDNLLSESALVLHGREKSVLPLLKLYIYENLS
jgi:serine/threonine protein kinase